MPVHYLTIGHLAKDLTTDGWRLGGTAAYGSLTARALGYTPGVVTSASEDLDVSALAGIDCARVAAPVSTTFENLYQGDVRTQFLRGRAAPLAARDVPTTWLRAPIIHLAAIARELGDDLFGAFQGAFVGLTPQGLFRNWADGGRVTMADWPEAAARLPLVRAAVLSLEDLSGNWATAEQWAGHAAVLVVTQGAEGCTVYVRGQEARRFPAPSRRVVDPTGAGDVFAAAFFIHLYETNDPWHSARFANEIASLSVTRPGLEGVPTPEEVGLARLRAEPAR